MRRIGLLAAFGLALAGYAAEARAQVTWHYTFSAVDAVAVGPGSLTVTGVLQGTATQVERTANFTSSYSDNLANCQRLATLAMAKPSEYLFRLGLASGYWNCSLVRVTP